MSSTIDLDEIQDYRIDNLKDLQEGELYQIWQDQEAEYNEQMIRNYNKAIFDGLAKGSNIKTGFKAVTNTDFWEKYMLNGFQFSAAKNKSEMTEIRELVFDDTRKRKDFLTFKKDAETILKDYNEIYLRVEYDLASRGAVLAEQWENDIWKNKERYPYAIYRTREDVRVRPQHKILDGTKFRIDSPAAQNLYVPNDWNCRCRWETTDESDGVLSEKETLKMLGMQVNINEGTGKKLRMVDCVPSDFRHNVAIDGIFPQHKVSYGKIEPMNYSQLSSEIQIERLNSRVYNDQYIQLAINDWNREKSNDIVFKNNEWFLNVRFTQDSLDEIVKDRKGFENIKHTVEHPTEMWGWWENFDKQNKVIMAYLKFDKDKAYIVRTLAGEIFEAKFVENYNKYRKGIKFYK